MRWFSGPAATFAVGACSCALAAGASGASDLPLTGTTAGGQEWRLQAAEPFAGDDAPTSWCLKLRYTTGITIDGHRFAGGTKTCGMEPAPRVSGLAQVHCESGSVYVFGGARASVERLRLHDRDGSRHRPQFAALPAGSGFEGRTFIAVVSTDDLPVALRARRVGGNPIMRLPRQSKTCPAHPGSPKGGEPSKSFASKR